jgi:carbon-monoxide dehydrogenase large subunit
VRLDLNGKVVVATGAASQGQGHETTFAQLAADALGVPLDWVTIVGGDTDAVQFGVGTFASRSAVTAGTSIVAAAGRVRERLVAAAATLLEAATEDIVVDEGRVSVRGVPEQSMSHGQLVQACLPTFAGAGVARPDFEASAFEPIPTVTYSNAVHVAQVEVDLGTGLVKLLDYVVAHDCGRVINPVIVEGQIHGGVAQGIGGGLLEELVFDEHAQLLTASLMDYLIPTSMDVPSIRTVHLDSESPRNPLGAKGVGEGGAIAPPAAIANAIEDALTQRFPIRICETPVTPARIVDLLVTHGSAG